MSRTLRLLAMCGLMMSIACGDDDGTPDGGMVDGGMDGMIDGGPDSPPGACDGIDPSRLCDTAGSTCSADTLTMCAPTSTGCLVTTTLDCASTGGTCETSGGSAACVMDDPCEGLPNLCSSASRACDGDDLVVCEMNAMGCLVETTTDCTPGMGVCDESGAMPACAMPVDPCDGVADACATAGTTCDGDSVVTCAANAFGCLVETTTDCTTVEGGTCAMEGTAAMCDAEGACEGRDDLCDAAGTMCAGPSLVTCAMDAFGCLVETTTACTDVMFGYCNDVADPATCDVSATDPCAGVVECTEGRACAADTLTVCAPDARGCFVETTTDCAAADRGACEDSGPAAICTGDPCPAATMAAVELGCGTTTLMGDTMGGTDLIGTYACGAGYDDALERVYRFVGTELATVTVTATRVSGTGDYDLFALDAGDEGRAMCAAGAPCLDDSRGFTAEEEVEFDFFPGRTVYIAYDLYSDTGETTTFTLDIECEIATCGDGTIAGPEQCDDSNMAAGDGCSATCQIEPGYDCDDETGVCTFLCGNGIVGDGAGEVCDDGNVAAGDGCSATCTVEMGAICDDEEPSVCRIIACGDGLIDGDETCDDSNMVAGDGCSDVCAIEDGYSCDDEPSTCELTCSNGEIDGAEACDDGNLAIGDGCSATCTVEAGFRCDDSEPSMCGMSVCGNGTTEIGETCDDGNVVDGDGCSSFCSVEGVLDAADRQYARPTGCAVVSGAADHYYEVVTYTNTGATDVSLTATAAYTGFDGYLVAYTSGMFSPTMTETGCLRFNDDFGGTGGSQIAGLTVAAGASVDFVVTTYDEGDTGAFTLTFAAAAIVASYSGAIEDADPTWARPSATCVASTSTMPLRAYDTYTYMNTSGAAQTVTITATWPSPLDGFLHVFTPPFEPTTPTVGCVVGNDDFGGARGSRLTGVSVAAGASIVIVASAFGETGRGPYSIVVTN